MEDFFEECRNVLKSLEWCHQWLGGEDARLVSKDIRRFKAAMKTFRKQLLAMKNEKT